MLPGFEYPQNIKTYTTDLDWRRPGQADQVDEAVSGRKQRTLGEDRRHPGEVPLGGHQDGQESPGQRLHGQISYKVFVREGWLKGKEGWVQLTSSTKQH